MRPGNRDVAPFCLPACQHKTYGWPVRGLSGFPGSWCWATTDYAFEHRPNSRRTGERGYQHLLQLVCTHATMLTFLCIVPVFVLCLSTSRANGMIARIYSSLLGVPSTLQNTAGIAASVLSHIERHCVPRSLIMELVTVSRRRYVPQSLAETDQDVFCSHGRRERCTRYNLRYAYRALFFTQYAYRRPFLLLGPKAMLWSAIGSSLSAHSGHVRAVSVPQYRQKVP